MDNGLPSVAATDYMLAYAEQLRKYMPNTYETLGTDGFGRSDTRKALRDFFEIDARYIVLLSVKTLIGEGKLDNSVFSQVIEKYNIDTNKPNPVLN
jgi:pyruvate dehydrogenase E1 component